MYEANVCTCLPPPVAALPTHANYSTHLPPTIYHPSEVGHYLPFPVSCTTIGYSHGHISDLPPFINLIQPANWHNPNYYAMDHSQYPVQPLPPDQMPFPHPSPPDTLMSLHLSPSAIFLDTEYHRTTSVAPLLQFLNHLYFYITNPPEEPAYHTLPPFDYTEWDNNPNYHP